MRTLALDYHLYFRRRALCHPSHSLWIMPIERLQSRLAFGSSVLRLWRGWKVTNIFFVISWDLALWGSGRTEVGATHPPQLARPEAVNVNRHGSFHLHISKWASWVQSEPTAEIPQDYYSKRSRMVGLTSTVGLPICSLPFSWVAVDTFQNNFK